MGLVTLVRDSFLSTTFDWLFQKLVGYVSDQLWNSNDEVCAQMESWKTLLPKIIAVLQLAEENQVANQFVKSYLDDLRDLAYDMEDILEEFVIDAKRSELIVEFEARPSKRQRVVSNVNNFFSTNKAKPNQEINSMVNDLSARLQKIDNQMHNLGLINLALKLEDKSHKVAAKRLPESSLLEDKVLGRDSDKDAILQRLLEDRGGLEQDFVIPIVGMGGLGKTTLARLIYNDKKLEGKFNLKAWVCVADVFDVPKITRTILEHVTGERCDFDFGLLQEKLKGKLSGCRFFLVLDDVWNKEYDQWDVLKRPFMSGAPGSKIIVTTRNKDVGMMMRGDDGVYNLELLQDDACLPLFTRHALGKENFDAHPNLQDVGEKLIKRCKRLPLALKTLGGVLRGKVHRGDWENILDNKIWNPSEDRSGILPTLRLSYNHLPSYLKRCFVYCALFPKDYEFDEKELVLLWMAEGLLQQQSHEKKQMEEDVGHQNFQELFSRSLFQQSSGDESRFVMHDLINDLAVDVAGEIYCNFERIMDDKKLEKARHLSFIPHHYEISKRFKVLDKLKHLRTFLPLKALNYDFDFHLSNRVLHDFLPTLNCLRVLSLGNYQISKLLDSFENLKHMRYIDLSNTQIKCLPESLGSLLFLQTLLLFSCEELTELPTTIGNLIDLHCLDVNDTPSLKDMPSGIGNLKNLLTLSKVIVEKASGMMKLSDLKNLLQLRGRLFILNLQNVLDVQDAREANLDKIHGLEELVLKWTTSNHDQDESVLQMKVLILLKPHSNLKSLKISCNGGENFPPWVCDPSLFFNLSSMELYSCKKWTLLPSLGLLPVLKKLIIEGMEAIEVVGPEFYGGQDCFSSLEVLEFKNMLNWKEWTSPAGSAGEFCRLRRLVIKNCPKLLGQLPSNLSSLKELDVRNCDVMLLKSTGEFNSLANLTIEKISKLTCLPKSFTQSFTTLETLYIGYCNDLTYLWEEGVEIEESLLPFNLKHLSLVKCGALESLPDAMMMRMDGSSSSNTSMFMLRLEKLEISECDSLKSFPRGKLPITLKYLRIADCKGLGSLPDADGDSKSNLYLEIRNVPCLYSSEGCHQLPTFLKKFTVDDGGEWLESFPERMLQHCAELQTIFIDDCKILKSLPNLDRVSNLVELYIYNCEVLEFLPGELGLCAHNLKYLRIRWCENFKFLPNTMYQLKSLQWLCMEHCPGIEFIPDKGLPPNLTELQLEECVNLKSVSNTMYQLTSLQSLRIPGGALTVGFGQGLQNLTSLQHLTIEQKFPLDIVLPSSVISLFILSEENLESIPGVLFQNLNSLQDLSIVDCPKLRSLPREAFPASLGELYIRMCPHLKRQRFEEKGDYWTLTWSIPLVMIV